MEIIEQWRLIGYHPRLSIPLRYRIMSTGLLPAMCPIEPSLSRYWWDVEYRKWLWQLSLEDLDDSFVVVVVEAGEERKGRQGQHVLRPSVDYLDLSMNCWKSRAMKPKHRDHSFFCSPSMADKQPEPIAVFCQENMASLSSLQQPAGVERAV